MGNPVVHFELTWKDAEAAWRFYSALFGWTIDSNNPVKYGQVDTGTNKGIRGAIEKQIGFVGTTIYIEVEDLDDALDRAEKLGAMKVMLPVDVPGVGLRIALFHDPGGVRVGLIQQAKPKKKKR
jgi:predicted enzyme related to lactoylglutathione lyase